MGKEGTMGKNKTIPQENDFHNETIAEQSNVKSDVRNTLNRVSKPYDDSIPESIDLKDLLLTNYNNTQME